MLICRNAEGVHGKKKVGNPCKVEQRIDSRTLVIVNASESISKARNKCPYCRFTCYKTAPSNPLLPVLPEIMAGESLYTEL